MTFQTIDQEYRAILKLHGSPDIQAYLCTCRDIGGENPVLITGVTDRALSKRFLPLFMNLTGQSRVGNFRDTFVRNKMVWAVSDYFTGTPFFEKIKEDLPAEEKIGLADALAEQIFAQNLPAYLQYEALHPENIVVNASRGVSVNFLLFTPERLGESLFPDVQKRFSDCLFALFRDELKNEASTEIKNFVDRLLTSSFSGNAELLRAFRRMSDTLQTALREGKLSRKGFLPRLFCRMAKYTAALPSILYWILVGALSGLLVFVCVVPETAPAQRHLIQNIGILRITHLPPVESTGTKKEKPETESLPTEETEFTETETLRTPAQETPSTETSQPEMG